MSQNYYFETLKKTIEKEKTPESVLSLIEHTDFFFKVLKVKFESGDPELLKQASEEIKTMKELLETYTRSS